MSLAVGTYTRVHVESATGPHGQPLPVRERAFGACSGHCASVMDWAFLGELLAERFFPDNPPDRYIDVYHHQTVDSAVGAWGFGGFAPSQIDSASYLFLDPGWTPQDIADNGWTSYVNDSGISGSEQHAYRRSSRPLVPNYDPYDQDRHKAVGAHTPREQSRTPRSLDDMRRMYYDIKMMYRMETYCDITSDGDDYSIFEHWPGGNESFYDIGTITLGTDVRAIARRVRETYGYRVRNNGAAWAMVEMWCAKDSPQFYRREASHIRTLVVPCTLGGTLDTSRFNAQALKSWTQSVYGTFADGHDYYAYARVASVYADIDFPTDYCLVGWNWTPQGD